MPSSEMKQNEGKASILIADADADAGAAAADCYATVDARKIRPVLTSFARSRMIRRIWGDEGSPGFAQTSETGIPKKKTNLRRKEHQSALRPILMNTVAAYPSFRRCSRAISVLSILLKTSTAQHRGDSCACI